MTLNPFGSIRSEIQELREELREKVYPVIAEAHVLLKNLNLIALQVQKMLEAAKRA